MIAWPGVYVLCLITSILCAGLLARAYGRTREGLLFWSGLCFGLLAINNLIVVLDMLVFRESDLTFWRDATSLAAVSVLLYGFIWKSGK